MCFSTWRGWGKKSVAGTSPPSPTLTPNPTAVAPNLSPTLPLPSAASCRRSSPSPCAATPICFRDAIFPGAAARCNSWSSLSASSTAHLRCPGAPKSIPLEEPVMLDPALPLAPLRLQRHTRHMVMPWKASEVVKYPRPAGSRPGSVSWGWHLHCAHLCRGLRMARRHLMQLRSNSNRLGTLPHCNTCSAAMLDI